MKKNYYMPADDSGKELWLKNFSSKLSTYAAKYNIAAADVTDMVNSALYFTYWLNYRKQFEEYLKKLTAFKNELRDGSDTNGLNSIVPQPPVFAPPPVSVPSGIFRRAGSIAGRIKKSMSYTQPDGLDLGIEMIASHTTDFITRKPALSVRLVDGGHPEIVWKKGDMDALEIHVDRGEGFAFCDLDTRPNYKDMFLLPGDPQVWTYKAIYRLDDHVVGDWSDNVSITVVKK
jgi:hypothetical protein